MKAKKIKNPMARFWKRSELNQTIKQCKEAGYLVEKDEDTTTVTNPENNDVVLMSLYNGSVELVRIDRAYFE